MAALAADGAERAAGHRHAGMPHLRDIAYLRKQAVMQNCQKHSLQWHDAHRVRNSPVYGWRDLWPEIAVPFPTRLRRE